MLVSGKCTACTAGTFSPGGANVTCQSCPANRASTNAAASCDSKPRASASLPHPPAAQHRMSCLQKVATADACNKILLCCYPSPSRQLWSWQTCLFVPHDPPMLLAGCCRCSQSVPRALRVQTVMHALSARLALAALPAVPTARCAVRQWGWATRPRSQPQHRTCLAMVCVPDSLWSC